MAKNNFENLSSDELSRRMDQIPEDIWIKCPYCGVTFFKKKLGKYKECPNCGYAFRIGAKERIAMMCDDFTPINTELKASKKFKDAQYVAKLKKAREVTGINESVLSGIGTIDGTKVAIAAMDWRFVMASLGTATGEILARLFEMATKKNLPVIVFTASGGARMQEGIHSLMQMAKVSEAVAEHSKAGLLYISVLGDPTTGGVTASFAMQGDILLSEPHALIGFAGRRVIEKTIQQRPPKDFQRSETLLKNGFLDDIVKRSELKPTLSKLLKWHEVGDLNG